MAKTTTAHTHTNRIQREENYYWHVPENKREHKIDTMHAQYRVYKCKCNRFTGAHTHTHSQTN